MRKEKDMAGMEAKQLALVELDSRCILLSGLLSKKRK